MHSIESELSNLSLSKVARVFLIAVLHSFRLFNWTADPEKGKIINRSVQIPLDSSRDADVV